MTDYQQLVNPKSDSYKITFDCLNAYLQIIAGYQKKKSFSCDDVFDEMHALSRYAIKAEPNKVMIRRTFTHLLNHCKRILKSDRNPKEILEVLKERVESEKVVLQQNAEKIGSMASRAIAQSNRVLTMSNDYLVQQTLLDALKQKRHFELFVLKSDPLGEGAEFAEFMAGQGIKTSVIDDSQMGVILPKINLVILGADRLYEKGFIHRSGTLPLCLTAKYFNVPIYLLADTRVILFERERSIKYHEFNGDEIYKPKNPEIQVPNIYYESAPFHLIYKVVCEDGIFEMNEFINWYLME